MPLKDDLRTAEQSLNDYKHQLLEQSKRMDRIARSQKSFQDQMTTTVNDAAQDFSRRIAEAKDGADHRFQLQWQENKRYENHIQETQGPKSAKHKHLETLNQLETRISAIQDEVGASTFDT